MQNFTPQLYISGGPRAELKPLRSRNNLTATMKRIYYDLAYLQRVAHLAVTLSSGLRWSPPCERRTIDTLLS
jgi:hypothetical protein